MSRFKKSVMNVEGNSLHMSMPFAKVDEARRLVSGFATLDNIDSQGDIVLAEASARAFARARGNIREMHQPIAAGRLVEFREDEFFDQETQKFYRGIFVTARVSEGAEDTWKKVLDGTLTGFSIGGEINEASNEFVKEAGRTIRFIKDYDLVELSLVDNPANQLANVFSIQKSATGSVTVKGMVAETFIENVFVCKVDDTIIVKETETEDCPMCGTKMENAGWFESTGENRTEKVQDVMLKFLNPAEQEAAPISDSEGGVEVAKNNETVSEEVVETTDEGVVEEPETEETEEVDEVAGTEEEEVSETPEELPDEGTEISKKIDELHSAVKKSLDESKEETLAKVSELEKKIDEATEQFLTKTSEIESAMGDFGKKIEAQKNRLADLESSLEKMNSSDAFRKSAELEDSPVETVQKNTSWNGAFSGKPHGFSVDNL